MPIQTPIRGLRSFCVAAQCLSFKQAASQLFITPSAVSHQIKQLEEQLGVVLFERQTRAIQLTQLGQQFFKAIHPIISELESTINDFSDSKENLTISIGLPEFFASELFVPRLSEWAKKNPDINLQLNTVKPEQKPEKVSDISIVLSNNVPEESRVHQLFPLEYVLCCSPENFKKWNRKGLKAVRELPLIVNQSRMWMWQNWAEQNQLVDFDPKQFIRLDSTYSVARAAQQGAGLALLPMPISKAWFDDGLLVRIFDQVLVTKDHYYLVQHENVKNQPALLTLQNWIKSCFTGYA